MLKSGLTFRQAFAYNLVSAIISYIGLVLGIIIGDLHSAHSWVFALTAGMFLYISLVDMVSHVISLDFFYKHVMILERKARKRARKIQNYLFVSSLYR